MNVWIPIEKDEDFKSKVCPHFGSAPAYMLVDTETMTCQAIHNENAAHEHGACQPLKALVGHPVDVVVVGGIGLGALMGLHSGGIKVFSSEFDTVEETIKAFLSGELLEVNPQSACSHHGHHGAVQHGRGFAARYRPGGCGGGGCG